MKKHQKHDLKTYQKHIPQTCLKYIKNTTKIYQNKYDKHTKKHAENISKT